jgi:hypothetical protein
MSRSVLVDLEGVGVKIIILSLITKWPKWERGG